MAVKNNLKSIRTAHRISQAELAEAVGSCSRTISRIERGDRNPSLEMALIIAGYFHVDVESIFTLD